MSAQSLPAMSYGRAYCYTCFKPQTTCVCERVPRLLNRTHVTVIQHPREQHHPLGTARFVDLGLQHVQRLVDIESRLRGTARPLDFPAGTGVLFPSPSARPLEGLPPTERPSHLIVIDGTWHQARTLYRDMQWLHGFPHYALNPAAPSRYRIRREPKAQYVSTLEAILHALHLLEPGLGGIEALLGAFDAMIDDQIRCAKESTLHHARRQKRQAAHRSKPRALAEHFERLVIVYAETIGNPSDDERELVYFAAERLRTSETFERYVLPPGRQVPASYLAHLSEHARQRHITEAVSRSAFEQAVAEFILKDDLFAAWSPSTLQWLRFAQKEPGRAVLLKAAYGSLRQGRGSLDAVLAFENVSWSPSPFDGRAGERIGRAKALARLLHQT